MDAPGESGKPEGLNDWFKMFESLFFASQNLERDRYRVFCHLMEKAGAFTKAVTKHNDYAAARLNLAKMFAWYCALLRSFSRAMDLEERVWEKFPKCCPYCLENQCTCATYPERPVLQPDLVLAEARLRHAERPRDLVHWQQMFDRIYNQSAYSRTEEGEPVPPTQAEASWLLSRAFNRTVEELGEVAEAMRVEDFHPDNLRNEIADVFAWMCALANLLPHAFGQAGPLYLADLAWAVYPRKCPDCAGAICVCRPEPVRTAISNAGVYADGVDGVTQVQVRNLFDRDYMKLQAEPADGTAALLLVDVDDFKAFNDTTSAGYAQGDAVLKAVAGALAAGAGPAGRVYRFGGDEFAVLLEGVSPEETEAIADTVEESVAALTVEGVQDSTETHRVSVTVGRAHEATSGRADPGLLPAATQDVRARKQARKDARA